MVKSFKSAKTGKMGFFDFFLTVLVHAVKSLWSVFQMIKSCIHGASAFQISSFSHIK